MGYRYEIHVKSLNEKSGKMRWVLNTEIAKIVITVLISSKTLETFRTGNRYVCANR